MAESQDTFYKSFSEKKLTGYGSGRRSRIEQHRGWLPGHEAAPGSPAVRRRISVDADSRPKTSQYAFT